MNFSHKFSAVLKRNMLEITSYRFAFLIDYAALFISMIIFFYISRLFPDARSSFMPYGAPDYFSFVLIGIAFMGFQTAALTSFTQALSCELSRGTLEAILMTRTSIGTLMMIQLFTNTARTVLNTCLYLFIGAVIFQAEISVDRIHWGSAFLCGILTLTSLSGLGWASAGFLMAFKKGDPINYAVHGLSRIFSGIYFPAALLPGWLQAFSLALPLTHSLSGFRKAVLQGLPPAELAGELGALALFSLILIPAGILFFQSCLIKAKRDGSLTFH